MPRILIVSSLIIAAFLETPAAQGPVRQASSDTTARDRQNFEGIIKMFENRFSEAKEKLAKDGGEPILSPYSIPLMNYVSNRDRKSVDDVGDL